MRSRSLASVRPATVARSLLCPLAALAGATACGGTEAPVAVRPSTPGVYLQGGASGSDTIGTIRGDLLRVQVVDSAGRPAAGRAVEFAGVPLQVVTALGNLDPTAGLARQGSSDFRFVLIDTTDAAGQVAVRVELGLFAGPVGVAVRVPTLGYADTARYTATVGGPVGVVVAPSDSAAYAGQGYTLRATTVDRGDNLRPATDPVTYSVVSGPATIDSRSGTFTATAIGRATFVAQAAGHTATASVSIVPRATVAAQQVVPGNGYRTQFVLMQLDGSGQQKLAPGLDSLVNDTPQNFAWSPDGRTVALVRGDTLDLVTPGVGRQALLTMDGPLLAGPRFARDGTWIYFAFAGTHTSPQGLYRVRPDGTGLQHLGLSGTRYGDDAQPSPSHDGRAVAYVSGFSPCGPTPTIRVLDLATNADRTYGAGRDYLVCGTVAAWSPTEDLIAYAYPQTGIGLIRSDGTAVGYLGDTVGNIVWMDWSPDGKYLLVSRSGGSVLLFDVQSGAQLPVPPLASYTGAGWRP